MVSSRNLKSGDEDFKVRQRMGPVFTDNLCTFIITANTNKYNLYNSDNLWQFSAVGWFGGVPLQKGGGGNPSIQMTAPAQRFCFGQQSNMLPHNRTAELLQVVLEIRTNQLKQEIQTEKKTRK